MKKNFYITTTLPYVNADPHIGFAWELVQADIIARYHRLLGEEVFFNTGTDEHGLKIYRKALEAGKEPQQYVDEYAAKFRNLKKALNLSEDLHFIQTTDGNHKKAAQEFWKRCRENVDRETGKPDIYTDKYKTKYCVGCELEKTDSELEHERCPIHPNLEIEIIEEENYFFRFSRYRNKLLAFYEKNPEFVLPASRFNEIKKFVEAGLNDFSISRLKEKMPWGVSVPGDDKQVMYVWFDALINYISTLGWPEDEEKFGDFWGTPEQPNAIQIAGKDNLRQQSAMWQAMLMSAGLPTSKQIIIHGFITNAGQKMSKSLGNVVDPYEVIEHYGADAFRYWLARELNTFEDGDFSWEKFKESYNANLANGLGNLVSRVMKMAAMSGEKLNFSEEDKQQIWRLNNSQFNVHMQNFRFNQALDIVWYEIKENDTFIERNQPFKMMNDDPVRAKRYLAELLKNLWLIGMFLQPFLPETSEKILHAIETNSEITAPLFPRK